MTWLEPLWLAYPTAALLVLTLLFALSVRWTLRAHPVPVLNYAYEPKYARHYPIRTQQQTNAWQVFTSPVMAASATSASVILPAAPVDPRMLIEAKRQLEEEAWGR